MPSVPSVPSVPLVPLVPLVAEWSEHAGVDLVALGTDAPASVIAQTQNAQPLIVATGLLSWLTDTSAFRCELSETVVAGHSLGAITAAAVAGVFTCADAVALAAARGRLMAAATSTDGGALAGPDVAASTSTETGNGGDAELGGMLAVVGAALPQVQDAAHQAGVTVATVNAPDQIVVAGPLAKLAAFVAPPKARTVKLPVSGPFHTARYREAAREFAAMLDTIDIAPPQALLLSDLDGTILTQPADIRAYLTRQLTAPIRWDIVTESLRTLGVSDIIELAPSGTLTRLAKRALAGVRITEI